MTARDHARDPVPDATTQGRRPVRLRGLRHLCAPTMILHGWLKAAAKSRAIDGSGLATYAAAKRPPRSRTAGGGR